MCVAKVTLPSQRCFCTLVQSIHLKTTKFVDNVNHIYLQEFLSSKCRVWGMPFYFRRISEIHTVFGTGHLVVPQMGIVKNPRCIFSCLGKADLIKSNGLEGKRRGYCYA